MFARFVALSEAHNSRFVTAPPKNLPKQPTINEAKDIQMNGNDRVQLSRGIKRLLDRETIAYQKVYLKYHL